MVHTKSTHTHTKFQISLGSIFQQTLLQSYKGDIYPPVTVMYQSGVFIMCNSSMYHHTCHYAHHELPCAVQKSQVPTPAPALEPVRLLRKSFCSASISPFAVLSTHTAGLAHAALPD